MALDPVELISALLLSAVGTRGLWAVLRIAVAGHHRVALERERNTALDRLPPGGQLLERDEEGRVRVVTAPMVERSEVDDSQEPRG
jgi:hypothetical protein